MRGRKQSGLYEPAWPAPILAAEPSVKSWSFGRTELRVLTQRLWAETRFSRWGLMHLGIKC
jgi:hypothetical protein